MFSGEVIICTPFIVFSKLPQLLHNYFNKCQPPKKPEVPSNSEIKSQEIPTHKLHI